TSGSTGRPKGVQVAHRNVVGFFVGMDGLLAPTSSDVTAAAPTPTGMARSGTEPPGVWLAVTSVSFDISVLELLWTLARGFRVVLQPELRALAAQAQGAEPAGTERSLAAAVAEHGVTHLQCTPSLARLMAEDAAGLAALRSVRTLLLGGEALPVDLARRLVGDGQANDDGTIPGPILLNMYGPTETTVWSTVHRVTPPLNGPIPIGRPIANTRVYVLDPHGSPTPLGVPGELYLGGVGVTQGYLGRPELTAERFVPDPFGPDPTARLYRTGDLVRYRADGLLEFLGRIDQQVKLRGFRIEPGEIEATLALHPGVAEAAVVVREDRAGDARLVAYLVGGAGVPVPEPADLRAFLGARLPDYMLPSAFVSLDALPLTPNGKLDRQALPAPEAGRIEQTTGYTAPRTSAETRIAEIWANILGLERVGIHDNFFDLGGDSLLLIRVHHALRQEFEHELSVVDLFQYPTVNALSQYLVGDVAPTRVTRENERAERQRAVLRWGQAGDSDEAADERSPVATTEGIAIVGMSGRFPGAASVDEFWTNIRNGVESIRTFSDDELRASGVVPAILEHPSYVKAQAPLDDVRGFDAGLFGFNAREADLLDPQQRLFLECAWAALEHAGYAPSGTPRSVGVYAGVGLPTYLLSLIASPSTHHLLDFFQLMITNDKDFVATRVAYKLNLSGPSVAVQTACSTSLVATVLACQALLTHQCDMALAGGCSVMLPDNAGYLYTDGGIVSPDGHCRPFDAEAHGTVMGSGAGVVVLKRLSEAVVDGDTIYAVIRGAALNNDGSDKIGFTAPSVEGQAEVIATAQALAGVSPDEISYVETHGTGTPLGDPIEVAGLTQAFRLGTDRAGFCAIGSVKSNVGHLDTAAGVAGLIKTVQALRHREIPPSLHFTQPNPKLELETSPFYVSTELQPWPEGPTPRRAGVSSFGLGGTNAHVVLEEAPPQPTAAPPVRPAELLLLSAATPTALEQATDDLAAYLTAHSDARLDAVAYTLQVGRASLPYRRAVVARTPADAVAALTTRDPLRVASAVAGDHAPDVAFMFAGGGVQYPGMGHELYATEPAYRTALDECLALLPPDRANRLRRLLCSATGDADAAAALEMPSLGLPALFMTQYALARLWQAWGVEPTALIGHSLGEYAAACLAGVLSLDDALALVVLRGDLFETLPKSGMTSVHLPEAEVLPLLGPNLSLAAVNADGLCVASGPDEELERLERDLDTRGASYGRLKIAVAAHSRMVEPILDAFEAKVVATRLSKPQLPYVSALTGTWITPEQAVDPAYWRRHLRETVRFADGLGTLLADPNRLPLEVGPGQILARLALRHPARQLEQTAVASFPNPNDPQPDLDAALLAAGRLWAAGVSLDPSGLWPEGGRRIALPTYPFERRRHWIDADWGRTTDRMPLARRTDPTDWLYAPSWRRVAGPVGGDSDVSGQRRWLLFCDAEGLGRRLAERLRAAGQQVACVAAGAGFAELGEDAYQLDPRDRSAYDRLLDRLRARDGLPERIVHLWSVSADDSAPNDGAQNGSAPVGSAPVGSAPVDGAPDRVALERGFYSLLYLAQALGEQPDTQDVDLAIVSGPTHVVLGDEVVQPERAAVLGPYKVLPQEYPSLTTRGIDVGCVPSEAGQVEALLGRLLDDLTGDPPPGPIAYRGPHRWVQELEWIRRPRGRGAIALRERGVYLITGGLGGIGLAIAGYLAQTVQARLVLVGRSAFPAPESWDTWLDEHPDDDPTSARIRHLRDLEAAGAEVVVERADVTDAGAVRALVARVSQRFGGLHGVVHAAGALHDGAAQLKTPEVAASVLAPKLGGTLALAAALHDVDCDFLALCSSISSILPA
ncbi:MAG: SDR family oxidoreductase, partial [Chloroflexi bacterium]|nr:SDR family oxidoreductase [Chloroflexota bacterium]